MNIDPLNVAASDEPEDLDTPYWLSIPCPDWCHQHHNHRDYGSDRRHSSEWDHRMWLTLEEPTRHDLEESYGGVQHSPCTMIVYLAQDYRETEPRIVIEEEHRRFGMNLTVAETAQLASVLNHALATADTSSDAPVIRMIDTADAAA